MHAYTHACMHAYIDTMYLQLLYVRQLVASSASAPHCAPGAMLSQSLREALSAARTRGRVACARSARSSAKSAACVAVEQKFSK